MLVFRRLTSDYYVANPDGSDADRLGEPIYVVRQTPASKERGTWVAFNEEGYLIGEYPSRPLAQDACWTSELARRHCS